MKAYNSVLIKLTFFLILGIVLGHFFSINYKLITSICIALILITGCCLLIITQNTRLSFWLSILLLFTTTCIGILTTTYHKQLNSHNHYTNQLNHINNKSNTISFKIREVLKPNNYYDKYIVDIIKLNDSNVSGKSLLNIEKDSNKHSLKVDHIYASSLEFKTLNSPLNPHQFNYKGYLKKQHIYHQLFLNHNELLLIKSKTHTLFGYASQLRTNINTRLKQFHFKTDELAIINALLLGQRQDISKEIYNSYTKAGAIHILAVSGLHVGILLILLNILFKPLEYFKHGKTYKIIIIVLLLWCFAVIAGLSASVVRAVTMFSIVAIALNLKRPTNIYNTLVLSIFILLLFKPMFIFDVGFQLSYLAVFAIVIIQPMLYNLWVPKYKGVNFFWNIFTVTLSAQIGIIPISLFYFHQFPSLFFISNLVIIPCLGIILGLGIIIILLALLNVLPEILASIYGFVISLMNDFVIWIASQEVFLFKHISFNLTSLLLSYLLIVSALYVLKKKSYQSIVTLLICIICCQSIIMLKKQFTTKDKFVIFHKNRFSMIGIQRNNTLMLHHNFNDSILAADNVITNFKIGEHIKMLKKDALKSVYNMNSKTMLIVDSLGIYNVPSFKPDIVLLRNSPKINLNRLIDSLKPKLIISDGSNFKTYRERWAKTCLIKKHPYYETGKKGAWIYKF